ncbi:PIH1 domain-containing protein 1 [Halocaridina rubra]|uniref:PIH1 domain-containing protein 1 n=1 Tax=Halocaridina rubra TaxID=373956 RepID=A0AAN9A7A2_HALRR
MITKSRRYHYTTEGICVKTKDDKRNKIFINVCTSDTIPTPEDITDKELITILESEEPSDFRIPMSIGQPHSEVDKSGEACVAYDVIISPQFFDKMSNSPLFRNFFMVATLEGIEEKYSNSLDKNVEHQRGILSYEDSLFQISTLKTCIKRFHSHGGTSVFAGYYLQYEVLIATMQNDYMNNLICLFACKDVH